MTLSPVVVKCINVLRVSSKPVLFPLRARCLYFISCRKVTKRDKFEKLAQRNDVPGMKDIWVGKFLITDVDKSSPKLFFMNTHKCGHHFYYFRKVTGRDIPEKDFDDVTYFISDNKQNLAGSIVAHDNYKDADHQNGIYTIEYWPTDPVAYKDIKLFGLISKSKLIGFLILLF